MKKFYEKPEIAVYGILPCMPLATSTLKGNTSERLEDDEELNWTKSTPSSTTE